MLKIYSNAVNYATQFSGYLSKMQKKIKFSLFLASLYIVAVIVIPSLHVTGIICPHDHQSSSSSCELNSRCIECGHNTLDVRRHIQTSVSCCCHSKTWAHTQYSSEVGQVILKSGHDCRSGDCPICQFIASLLVAKSAEFKSLDKDSITMESNIDFIALFLSKKINPANPTTGPPLI